MKVQNTKEETSMKTTGVGYCQVCKKDFENNEVVYYITNDNSIVCDNCALEANALTEDIQLRIFEGD